MSPAKRPVLRLTVFWYDLTNVFVCDIVLRYGTLSYADVSYAVISWFVLHHYVHLITLDSLQYVIKFKPI